MKEALVKAKAEMIYLADYVGGTWVEDDMMAPLDGRVLLQCVFVMLILGTRMHFVVFFAIEFNESMNYDSCCGSACAF